MPALGVGRFNRLLQRLLEIKADPPAPDLAGEIMPVIVLEGDRPEWLYLMGHRLIAVGFSLGAAAGQPNLIRVRNPAASGVIATADAMLLGSSTAHSVNLRIGRAAADLGTTFATMVLDQRMGAANASSLIASSDQTGAAVVGTSIGRARVPAEDSLVFPAAYRFVLAPGDSFDIFSSESNLTWAGVFTFRERALEASER